MAIFSKRHYECFERLLKEDAQDFTMRHVSLVERIATMFADDNPCFNREQFLDAIYTPEQRHNWNIR